MSAIPESQPTSAAGDSKGSGRKLLLRLECQRPVGFQDFGAVTRVYSGSRVPQGRGRLRGHVGHRARGGHLGLRHSFSQHHSFE